MRVDPGPRPRFLALKDLEEKEVLGKETSTVQCLGEVVFNSHLGISCNF